MSPMCGPSQDRPLLTLGHMFVTHAGAAYEQAVISGQVVVHNTLSGACERMWIRMEPASHCCVFPLSQVYVPRLWPEESEGIVFRLSSLERRISARFLVQYETAGQSFLHQQELLITAEPESLAGRAERRIFVSYTRPDYQRILPWLAAVRSCGSVWIDKPEMPSFEWFAPRIRSAVREASIFLVFLSVASVRSPSVQDEIKLALAKRARGEQLAIIAAVLEACEVPAALAGSEFVEIGATRETGPLIETLKRTFSVLEQGAT